MMPLETIGLFRSVVGAAKDLKDLLLGRNRNLLRARRKLIIVPRPFPYTHGWIAGGDAIIHISANFTLTNPNQTENLLVTIVQIRRISLRGLGDKQVCHSVDIGRERVDFIGPGVIVSARTATTLIIRHPLHAKRLPRRGSRLLFQVILTDQFNKRHATFVRLPEMGLRPQ